MNQNQDELNSILTQEVREKSNQKARSTWERKAVGSQRAEGTQSGTAEYYSKIRSYRYGYETAFIPDFFGFACLKDKRVLEVGIGNGIDGVEMMRNGAQYTGIDITTNHLELTRRYVALEQADGKGLLVEDIIEGDLMETDLPGNYDVIYSFGVLHHIAHEEEFLQRMNTLLAKEGELRIALYAKFSLFNAWMNLQWWLRDRRHHTLVDWQSHLAEGSYLGDPVVIKIRHRQEIQSILERAGFEVIRYGRKGFVQGYLPGIGRLLSPNGWVLNCLAYVLGWYHCFVCRRAD